MNSRDSISPGGGASFTPLPPIEVGETIAGKYVVDAVLQRSTSGCTLRAHLAAGEARVQVRILAGLQTRGPLVPTAGTALRLKSDLVARVLEFGVASGRGVYIVTEFVEGKSLRAVISGGRVDLDRAAEYALHACAALTAAHSAGLPHRDVRPENLLLTSRSGKPVLVLTNFGVAFSSDVDVPATQGSPVYCAPELQRGWDEADARADIWSLGAVFYELLTGHAAFRVPESGGRAAAVQVEPAPLAHVLPDAPEALQRLLDKWLATDPAARFQTVSELSDALAPFARHRPTAAASTSLSAGTLAERDDAKNQKTKKMLIAIGVVLLLGGLFAIARTRGASDAALPSQHEPHVGAGELGAGHATAEESAPTQAGGATGKRRPALPAAQPAQGPAGQPAPRPMPSPRVVSRPPPAPTPPRPAGRAGAGRPSDAVPMAPMVELPTAPPSPPAAAPPPKEDAPVERTVRVIGEEKTNVQVVQ